MKLLGREFGNRLSPRDRRMTMTDVEVQARIERAFGAMRPYTNTELWAMVIGNAAGRYKYPAYDEQSLIDECLTVEDLETLEKSMVELSRLGHVSVAMVVHDPKFWVQEKYLDFFRHLSFNYEDILRSSSSDKEEELKRAIVEDLGGRDRIGARIFPRNLSLPNSEGRIQAWRVAGTYGNRSIEMLQRTFKEQAAQILNKDEAILVARTQEDKPQIVTVNDV